MRFFRATLLLVTCCSIAQQPAADIRSELARIDYRHARDLNDYVAKCDQVRSILPQLEEFYNQSRAKIVTLKKQHSNDAQFQKMADFFDQLNAEDRAGLEIVKEEMQQALELRHLPESKRQAFFDDKIKPLQKREDDISSKEIAAARKAQEDGIPLPEDILKALQSR